MRLNDILTFLQLPKVTINLMPEAMREGHVVPIADPPSRNAFQDYPYFGVFKADKLVAYAAGLVTGELCSLNDLYGHADYMEDGVVPLAIVETARCLFETYPM